MKKKPSQSDDLEVLLQDIRFRRFIIAMWDECGIFGESYVPGDTHATARELGKKSYALNLYHKVMRDHVEWFVLALREARNEDNQEKEIDISSFSE